MLELALLWRCKILGLDPRCREDLEKAKNNFKWDATQNLDESGPTKVRDTCLNTLCTGAQVYSFQHDRRIHPLELLRSFGWPASTNPSGLAMRDLADLTGEVQSFQGLAVASWALLLALGSSLTGLWTY
jgi:hypothetical protein